MRTERRTRLILAVLLALAAAAVYYRVLHYPFLSYDDNQYITENDVVRQGLTSRGFAWAFTATVSYNWHPLTWLSHMLDCQIFGLNPIGHHATNLALHVANTVLLFLILGGMTGRMWRSALVAALFAVHPLHVESVAWIAERKDVLSAFFWLLMIWAYVCYAARPRQGAFALVLLLFALGLMSKPMLVTAPVVLLLLDWWPLGRFASGPEPAVPAPTVSVSPSRRGKSRTRDPRHSAAELVSEKIPLFLLVAASCVVTYMVQRRGGAMNPAAQFPPGVRAANALTAYVRYIGKTFWPKPLAVLYPHPGYSLPAWEVAGSAVLLVALTAPAILLARRRPYVAVGWLWFVITLVPTIGIIQVGLQSMADRYTYIPLIGLFIIFAWGVPGLVPSGKAKARVYAMTAVALVVIVALMVSSWVEVGCWRSTITLFKHSVASTSDNYSLLYSIGAILSGHHHPRQAEGYYRKSIAINPSFEPAQFNLGATLVLTDRYREAIPHLVKAARLKPEGVGTHGYLAFAYCVTGQYRRAWKEIHLCRRRGEPIDPRLEQLLSKQMPEPRD